jgi:hypothetical protein
MPALQRKRTPIISQTVEAEKGWTVTRDDDERNRNYTLFIHWQEGDRYTRNTLLVAIDSVPSSAYIGDRGFMDV